MNRRHFIQMGVAAGLGAGAATWPETWAQPLQAFQPLKTYGMACGIHVGTQAEIAPLHQPDFARFVISNFDMLTAGNELKWGRLRPDPKTFAFSDADWMVNFAQQNGMLFHGHNLCWNTGNPKWFDSVLNKSNARQFLVDHITTVMKRYAGKVDSWDVVNEPLALWNGRPDGLYKGPWLDLLGPEYIDIAFDAAAKADPKALLVLNLHHIEQGIPDNEKTRQLSLVLLKQLKQRGVPVQAIGVESHLSATAPLDPGALDRYFKQVRDMGLQILFTEIDIDDTGVPGSTAQRDQVVADYYFRYLSTAIPASGTSRVIFWTATDKNNWMEYVRTPQFQRADGAKHRPGLLDESLQPKLAFSAAAKALQQVCGQRG